MFDYAQFKDNLNIWKRKPLFWLIMVFVWPLFLLWFLVLWSINDLKKRPSNKKIYQTKGLYGLLIAFLILLGGVNSSLKDTESKTESEDKVSISSSSKKTSSVDKASLASSKARSASESSKIASSESASSASEASSKASSEAANASSKAAKASSEAADKDPNSYKTGITYDQVARMPDDYEGKKMQFTGRVIQVIEDKSETQIRLAVDGNSDNIILVGFDPDILNGSRVLEDDLVTVSGTSVGTVSYKSTMGGKITIPAMAAKILNDQGKASDDYGY